MTLRSPFVGRGDELSELDDSLHDLFRGKGSVVLISGDLGIGKTRLVEEFANHAREGGASVFHGRWYESREMPAYVGFRECLLPLASTQAVRDATDLSKAAVRDVARLGPEFSALLGTKPQRPVRAAEGQQYRLWVGISLLLKAAASVIPTLLTLDDLQWADSGSLSLLAYLGQDIRPMSLLVVAAYRQEGVATDHPLREAIAELRHAQALTTVRLRGLSATEVGALVAGISRTDVAAEFVDALHKQTQGNPFFVEEIMKHIADRTSSSPAGSVTDIAVLPSDLEVPEVLQTVIGRRLSRLSPACRTFLNVAAVAGRQVEFSILERASASDRDALRGALDEALEASVIVEPAPGVTTFTHPLIRSVVYRSMAASERAATHHALAEALELHYGSQAESHAREIGHHLAASGEQADPEKTVRYCLSGGRQALGAFAYDEARQLLSHGQRLLDGLPTCEPKLRAQLLIEMAYMETVLARPDEAVRLYREALSTCETLGDEDAATELRGWLAGCLLQYGRSSEALLVTRDGVARAYNRRSHSYYELVRGHALALLLSADIAEAEPWVGNLLELAYDEETTAQANHVAGAWYGWGAGDYDSAQRCFDVARRLAHDEDFAAQAACDYAVTAYVFGRLESSAEAEIESQRAASIARRVTTLADLHAFRSMVHVQRGEWEQAQEERQRWRRIAATLGGTTTFGQFAGRGESLERLWKYGPAAAREALDVTFPLNQPLLALLSVESGDRELADKIIQLVQSIVPSDGRGLLWMAAALPVASTLCGSGSQEATRWYHSLAAYRGCLFDWFVVDLELARISALDGRWSEAESHFTESTQVCKDRGLRAFLGQTHYHWAVMLLARRAAGDRRRALLLLAKAEKLFGELGLDYLQEKVRTVLSTPRRGRPPTSHRAGFTQREVGVLALLAQGKSNREIASCLFVAEKTVEHHLGSIYAKLDVPGRAGAMAYALREGIV